jgi:hypothetical protein
MLCNLTCNRNIGVLQTTVAEVVTVEAHQGQERHVDYFPIILTILQPEPIQSCPLSGVLGMSI